MCPDVSSADEVNELLTCSATLFSGTNTLIVLDDCAVSKDLKQRSSKFIDLAFSGRHEGLSDWVLTQQLTSILKPFREQVACVIAFHNQSKAGTKALFEDYKGDIDQASREGFVEVLKKHQFSRLFFSQRHPYDTYLEIPAPEELLKKVKGSE